MACLDSRGGDPGRVRVGGHDGRRAEAHSRPKNGTTQFRFRARNVIFFVGDGLGVSTVTAARIFSVGVAGQLVLDQFPYTALSRTYSADSITPDSAPTMTAMMSGVNTNQSVIGFGETTEPNDFNHDGDGEAPWTLLEQAKARGMKVGVVSTARSPMRRRPRPMLTSTSATTRRPSRCRRFPPTPPTTGGSSTGSMC